MVLGKSYLLAYLTTGLTLGCTLTYITDKWAFVPISLGIGLSCALIKDTNMKNNENQMNGVVKSVLIYTIGPLAFIAVIGIGLIIAIKK